MYVRDAEGVVDYLNNNRGWLLRYGLRRLPEPALVEDAMQELARWALVGVSHGREFNLHYLGMMYRSFLRNARLEWMRSTKCWDASPRPGPQILEQAAELAEVTRLPDAELVIDALVLGTAQAAARHGLTTGAVHVRIHRFRARYADEFRHLWAA